jgi:hypothetical protein
MNIQLFGTGTSKVEDNNESGLVQRAQSRRLQTIGERVARKAAPISLSTGKVRNWIGEIGMGLVKLGLRFERFASREEIPGEKLTTFKVQVEPENTKGVR